MAPVYAALEDCKMSYSAWYSLAKDKKVRLVMLKKHARLAVAARADRPLISGRI